MFKNLLNNILIFLIKTLFFIKKIVVFVVSTIWKIIIFILELLFFKLIVKLYYNYILIYKKIKEINKTNNSRLYLFKKNIPLLVIIIIFIFSISQNSIKKTSAQGISGQIHKTTLAKNIKSDFAEVEPEELIIETIDDLGTITNIQPRYVSETGSIVAKTQISADYNNQDNHFVVFEHRDTLSGQAILTVEIDPKNRDEIIEYIVQSGDTISGIAANFGLSVNTILWENNLGANSLIRPGSKLTILPSDGIMHTVKRNENISKLASTYKVEADKIIEENELEIGETLKIGQKVFIPGGRKITPVATVTTRSYSGTRITPSAPTPAPQPTYTGGKLLWPTVGSRITQYYSWRHQGLDIANRTGTPLYASEGGVVERSGWNTGYGYNVVINHGGGMKTLYAHASKLHVRAGDRVNRGDIIADMGSTGWSTGPHIHFEVIVNGVKQNPLNYLR